MSDAFVFWKTAHIVGAAILLGTGLGIAFFSWFGYRAALQTRDIGTLRSTLRLTVIADACFTAPAVLFQAISGVVLMKMLGWPLVSPWAIAVWSLFVLIGACWLPVVAIQAGLSRESQQASSIDGLSPRFHQRFKWWCVLGFPAFAAVIFVFYLMVGKPISVAGL